MKASHEFLFWCLGFFAYFGLGMFLAYKSAWVRTNWKNLSGKMWKAILFPISFALDVDEIFLNDFLFEDGRKDRFGYVLLITLFFPVKLVANLLGGLLLLIFLIIGILTLAALKLFPNPDNKKDDEAL